MGLAMRTSQPLPTLSAPVILGIVGAALICSLFLWPYPILLPLKILAVYLHEACHALAAILTGGTPIQLSVRLDQSGHVLSSGGFFPLIAAAGYIGSASIGALLIALSRHPVGQKIFVTVLGGLLFFLTLSVIRPWQWEFWAGALFTWGWITVNYQRPTLAQYLNLFMGSFLGLYALHEFNDFLYAVQYTDAGILANSWGLPFLAGPIALVWMLINLTMLYQALRYATRS